MITTTTANQEQRGMDYNEIYEVETSHNINKWFYDHKQI